jgi:ubiquinone/menaquinone biosynthesis C-methylase UbiE
MREQRRAVLQRMLSFAPFARDAELSALDAGAGYGLVTEEMLKAFPNARVTLLDYSEPMFEHARKRLAPYAERLRYVISDLSASDWTAHAGGPFDLALSAIAIHNLRSHELIAACYRAIVRVLRPGGVFLDCDLVTISGGLGAHLEWLRAAGFTGVKCVFYEEPRAILVARRG